MYGRTGLDRFKKAQTLEPFSVANSAHKPTTTQSPSKALSHSTQLHSRSDIPNQQNQYQNQQQFFQKPVNNAAVVATAPQQVTQVGGGQSTWQPPDWAIEPRPGVYYLDVLKDGEVLDRINLDKRRHIFGRQLHTCDFVLDHQSVSRQHAAVVPHKNGRSAEIASSVGGDCASHEAERPVKRTKKTRVAFRDQVGGELVEVVGVSDGADVETEPGPMGVKEGSSLVGKYESLVQTTVIPKGKESSSVKEVSVSPKGVTDKLQEVLNKVKAPPKGGIYDDLYGESLSSKVGSSWAYSSVPSGGREASPAKDDVSKAPGAVTLRPESNLGNDDSDDDLFG